MFSRFSLWLWLDGVLKGEAVQWCSWCWWNSKCRILSGNGLPARRIGWLRKKWNEKIACCLECGVAHSVNHLCGWGGWLCNAAEVKIWPTGKTWLSENSKSKQQMRPGVVWLTGRPLMTFPLPSYSVLLVQNHSGLGLKNTSLFYSSLCHRRKKAAVSCSTDYTLSLSGTCQGSPTHFWVTWRTCSFDRVYATVTDHWQDSDNKTTAREGRRCWKTETMGGRESWGKKSETDGECMIHEPHKATHFTLAAVSHRLKCAPVHKVVSHMLSSLPTTKEKFYCLNVGSYDCKSFDTQSKCCVFIRSEVMSRLHSATFKTTQISCSLYSALQYVYFVLPSFLPAM